MNNISQVNSILPPSAGPHVLGVSTGVGYQNMIGGPLSPFIIQQGSGGGIREDDPGLVKISNPGGGQMFAAAEHGTSSAYPGGGWGHLANVLKFLNIYYTLFIIIVGLLGNTASLAVFLGTHLRSRSSSYYLAAVSLADSGFLLCLLSVWFTYLDVNIYNREGGCQLVVYLTYVFSFSSVWLIVAFTLERFIAICFPLDRPSVCTIRRAKTNIALVAVGGIVFYSFVLVTAGIIEPKPTTHGHNDGNGGGVSGPDYQYPGGMALLLGNGNRSVRGLNDSTHNGWDHRFDPIQQRYMDPDTVNTVAGYNRDRTLMVGQTGFRTNLTSRNEGFVGSNERRAANTRERDVTPSAESTLKIGIPGPSLINPVSKDMPEDDTGMTYPQHFNADDKLMTRKEAECGVKIGYLNAMNIFNHVDTFVTLFIPFAILILLNVLICRKIVLFKRHYYRSRKSESECRDSTSAFGGSATRTSNATNFVSLQPNNHITGMNRNGAVRLCSFDMTAGHRLVHKAKPSQQSTVNANYQCGHVNHSISQNSPRSGRNAKDTIRSSSGTSEAATNPKPLQPAVGGHSVRRESLLIRHHYSNNIFAKTQMSITKLLLIISTVFLVLNFPSYILRMRVYILNLAAKDYENSEKYQMLENLFQLLYYTNFSINFLLYSVCGTNFRRALMRLFKNRCKAFSENSRN